MSRQPRTVLVLGGIRSGKSGYAESLVEDAARVRYVATATEPTGDAEWAARVSAHRSSRPDNWSTEEFGKTPEELPALVAAATADDTIIVDDIGGWLTAMLAPAAPDGQPEAASTPAPTPTRSASDLTAAVEALAVAVGNTAARIVFVSPEVGLSIVPATSLGRTFADACGSVNRVLAEACDGVVLVLAGQPTWIKATPGRLPDNAVILSNRPQRVLAAVPVTDFDLDVSAEETPIELGMSLPLPDTTAATAATELAERLPIPGAGLGALTDVVGFAAGAQATTLPGPFRSIRVVQIHGVHLGAIASGDDAAVWADRLAATRAGESPLARLAAEAGAAIELIDAGQAAPIEDGDAATADEVAMALRRGWAAANAAADRGDDLLVIAASGPGIDAAAAAVVAAVTTTEVASLIGRVWHPVGRIDDEAWMRRCIAIRDARLRVRGVNGYATDAPTALAGVGGPSLAVATGLLLGAAFRKTPVLLDGPVGAASALLARDYAAQTRMWCLLTDVGNQPTVRVAADMVGLSPLVDLGLGLGEGCNALAVLPLIQSALTISSSASSSSSSESLPPAVAAP